MIRVADLGTALCPILFTCEPMQCLVAVNSEQHGLQS